MFELNFDKPIIMGIVNVTPDSFYAKSRSQQIDSLFQQIETMIDAGADIIDIGAESTRPGAEPVSQEEEIKRLSEILPKFKSKFNCVLSLDTMKSEVARFGLDNGVDIINDVSGLTFDKKMPEIIAAYNAGVVLMHMKGFPKTMQDNPLNFNVVDDVLSFFRTQLKLCNEHNINSVFIDPGIGFGKDLNANLELLRHLDLFLELEKPIVIGTSRKSFIEKISGSSVENRLGGTIGSNIAAWKNGANVFRVHDVLEVKQAFDVYRAVEVRL
jgi:dihydropteroate synthase